MNRHADHTNRRRGFTPGCFSIPRNWPPTTLITAMAIFGVAAPLQAIGPEQPAVILSRDHQGLRSQADFAAETIEIELRSDTVSELAITTVIENARGETVATGRTIKSISTPTPTSNEDTDGDGVPDAFDNCIHVPNAGALACDTDMDGYGNACDADFNNDGVSDGLDFAAPHFMLDFSTGTESSNDDGLEQGTDMNCDGTVDGVDFSPPYFLTGFAAGVPGVSGLACAGTVPCTPDEAALIPPPEVTAAKYGEIFRFTRLEMEPLDPGVYSSTVDVDVTDADYDVPVTVSQTEFFEVSWAGVRDVDSHEFSLVVDGPGYATLDKNSKQVIVHDGKGFEIGSEKSIRQFFPKIVDGRIENLDQQLESGSAGEPLANDRSEIEEI